MAPLRLQIEWQLGEFYCGFSPSSASAFWPLRTLSPIHKYECSWNYANNNSLQYDKYCVNDDLKVVINLIDLFTEGVLHCRMKRGEESKGKNLWRRRNQSFQISWVLLGANNRNPLIDLIESWNLEGLLFSIINLLESLSLNSFSTNLLESSSLRPLL